MATSGADDSREGSVLLTVTGPILRFLAMREADMIARGEQPQETKMVFWPFAAAGVTLFGVGVAGGHYFMKGDVSAMDPEKAAMAAEAAAPKGQRRARAAALAREAAARVVAEGGVQAVHDDAASLANRQAAVRTAATALGLGTVLALSGAAVLIRTTTWYLQVNSAEEFGAYLRSRLPDRMRGFVEHYQLEARKASLQSFVKDDLGAGAFLARQEAARRERSASALVDRGVLTPLEFEAERRRIAQEGGGG